MNEIGKTLGLTAVAAVALVLVLSGSVAATGSGYNQSYTQSSTTSNAAVGLTGITSSYSGGPNLTASITLAGAAVLDNAAYVYSIYFGGTASSNASAIVEFSNITTAGVWYAYSTGGFAFGNEAYVLSNGGATLTFQLNISVVGPPTNFAVDAYASYSTTNAFDYSWLGTDYQPGAGGGGGGVSCNGTSCTVNNAPANSLFGGFLLYAILGIVVVVVVIVVVLLLVMRKRPPTTAPPPMQGGWMPPGQPGMAPPPPQYQPMTPPPPPPGA